MTVVDFPEIGGQPFEPAGEDAAEIDAAPAAPAIPASEGDLLEWTPERAAAIVRAFGFGLHTLDPATQLEGGEELWRATAAEAEEIGTPLSRILARYEPARRLVPIVDEVELGAAFVGYAKRNMRDRGRVVLAERERQAFGGDE